MGTVNVAVLCGDLMFRSRISEVGKALGVEVNFFRAESKILESLSEQQPTKVIIDLNGRAEFEGVVKELQRRQIPVVGFYSHVDTALAERAEAAGIDRVIPRSRFIKELPELIGQSV